VANPTTTGRYLSPLIRMFAGLLRTSRPPPETLCRPAPVPRAPAPSGRSASEARLAACRRMHPRRLWARIRRRTWSPTSIKAARIVLRERANQE